MRQHLCIETDEVGQLLIDTRPTGARWVHTYPTRELLEERSTADFDAVHCVEWTGARLRSWLRDHAPDAGALHHADRYTETIVLRPEAQPVQRISLEG